MSEHYAAIIIGSGQAGNPLARALGQAGWKTALIERAYIGGSCINYGCTPTKTMFNSARVAYLARRAADYGVHHGDVAVNMAEVRERKQKVVESFRNSGLRGLEQTENVALFWGDAHFTGAHAIEVNQADGQKRRLTAEEIFINTGGRPATPLIDGLDKVPMLDSTLIMELDEVPEHLLVLGGGYIGLEFGQMFRRFGSDVTIVQRDDHVLPREDSDVTVELQKALEKEGIRFLLRARPTRVERQNG